MAKLTRKRRREIRNSVRGIIHRMLCETRFGGFKAGLETEYAQAYLRIVAQAYEGPAPEAEEVHQ